MCRARGSCLDREHCCTPTSDVVSHFASPQSKTPTSTKLCEPHGSRGHADGLGDCRSYGRLAGIAESAVVIADSIRSHILRPTPAGLSAVFFDKQDGPPRKQTIARSGPRSLLVVTRWYVKLINNLPLSENCPASAWVARTAKFRQCFDKVRHEPEAAPHLISEISPYS